MKRISFTVLLAAASDTVTVGQRIFPGTLIDLAGTIGHTSWATSCPPAEGNE
ncbi:hypothetical protein RJT17_35365 [Streptomyces sp. P5-A9]|uniref:hypothetical protein n=1 Tax=Streptomyces sp. P5-A9 TaxID=3071730 RepID=UPI002FCC90DD